MVPQVAAALCFIDAVSAAGVGLVLAFCWDAMRLLAGKGKIRLFICDILTFLLAALVLVSFSVSKTYSGHLRWFMTAGAFLGFVAYLQLVAPFTKRVFSGVCWALGLPFVLTFRHILCPLGKGLQNAAHSLSGRAAAAAKKRRKRRHKKGSVLYDSK